MPINVQELLGPFLFDASIGGVPFWMVDGEDEPGRRVLRFLFPDQDQPEFQDLGQEEGEITVTGLVIGPDFLSQAESLRAVFRSPGPWTLVNPWLGELQVVQAERKPKFTYAVSEISVARFTAVFFRYDAPQPPAPDTLQDLLGTLDDVRSAASGLLQAVLAPGALTVASIGAVQGFAANLAGTWSNLVANADSLVQTAAAGPIAALNTIGTLTEDASYAGNVCSLLGGVSAAIGQTSIPLIPAAVAPGGILSVADAVDGRTTAGLMLSAASDMVAPLSALPITQALSLATQSQTIADAVGAASDITFDSQQEATTWRETLSSALDGVATQAASLATTQPIAAGTLWQSLTDAKSSLAADMNATIGRLPSVATFTPPAAAAMSGGSLWSIAQHLSGDNPAKLVSTYLDLVNRNDIVNPGAPPPGPLEVLTP